MNIKEKVITQREFAIPGNVNLVWNEINGNFTQIGILSGNSDREGIFIHDLKTVSMILEVLEQIIATYNGCRKPNTIDLPPFSPFENTLV